MLTSEGRIVLTGFMGTGKSTVGRLLADRLGLAFVDTDQLIESRHGPIPELFSSDGEAVFRDLEREVAHEVAEMTATVVATGGRLMLDPGNAAVLGRRSLVVALTAATETILERVLTDGPDQRPLLAGPDPAGRVRSLLADRAPAYARFATIATDDLRPDDVVDRVVALAAHIEPMRAAIDAAATARRRTSPNPWVGAVLTTADGTVVASGATEPPGGRHAEIVALDAARTAGLSPAELTLYSTLEPCSHHGRTGPCADAIIAAGIRRVVTAVLDPDPQVAGRGVRRLAEAGVDVVVGVGAVDVDEQLAPYLHHRRTGRPYVVAKMAITADGATATADGSSQWITGLAARRDTHRIRAESDAILVGAGTVRADDPSLTVRHVDGPDPRRIVLGVAPKGAKVHPCTEYSGELAPLLDQLGSEGVVQLMVEGGAYVLGSFHRSGLIDRYVLYVAPAMLGGDDGRAVMTGPGAPSVDDIWRGRFESVTPVGRDLRIEIVAED